MESRVVLGVRVGGRGRMRRQISAEGRAGNSGVMMEEEEEKKVGKVEEEKEARRRRRGAAAATGGRHAGAR